METNIERRSYLDPDGINSHRLNSNRLNTCTSVSPSGKVRIGCKAILSDQGSRLVSFT